MQTLAESPSHRTRQAANQNSEPAEPPSSPTPHLGSAGHSNSWQDPTSLTRPASATVAGSFLRSRQITPIPPAVPTVLLERLRAAGVNSCQDWVGLGRNRFLIFGITGKMVTAIDAAIAEVRP
jgi:hypothetical protein